jgi:hypothetical protein
MSDKNRESLLWQKVKKGLVDCFLTRIESSTINGIPDIHGVHKSGVFWIELKSDEAKYPKLNKWKETPSQRSLKLYRPVSSFTDPRSLEPRSSFSFPYHWPTVQQQLVKELVQPEAEEQELVLVSRPC